MRRPAIASQQSSVAAACLLLLSLCGGAGALRVRLPRMRGAAVQLAPKARVAVLGGGFAGLTAARELSKDRDIEVLLVDQREYFEYTPGILRAWVDPSVHKALVNPIRRLLRSKRATFQRVPPGCSTALVETDGERPLRFTVAREGEEAPLVDYECDFAILATGGEQAPISDDRQLSDGSIAMRRRRLGEQVAAVMENARSALVVGGGLTGVELAAELAETLGPGVVTLAVGPTLPKRGRYPGDPGAGVLPGFRDTSSWRVFLRRGSLRRGHTGGAVRYASEWLERHGVDVCEEWAVPPPAGATLANVTAAARPACARTWRRAGEGRSAVDWEQCGPEADLEADVVFDCRGLRPNTRESYSRDDRLGLPAGVVGRSGWLRVDERFRLCRREYVASADYDEMADEMADELADEAMPPTAASTVVYGGRAFSVGDGCEKDKMERTAANAHAEGEYVANEIRRAVNDRPPQPPYAVPPRLTAISLGVKDGLVVLGRWVAVRG